MTGDMGTVLAATTLAASSMSAIYRDTTRASEGFVAVRRVA
jgi:hypothetical protein